jgi:hypothetical protein
MTDPVINDATIKTDRPVAAKYNGVACKVLRKVELPDVAFISKTPQVVVLIDGKELYFFTSEVIMNKDAAPATKTPLPTFPTFGATSNADDAAWKSATTANTVAGYDNYIAQYPSGAHVTEAKMRRDALPPIKTEPPPFPSM